jgi:mannosyltransferase OCH1-like enzyme
MKSTLYYDLEFHPFFPGCGILSNSEGDLLSSSILTEVKTGDRQILPSDIRQLIIYSAMNHLAGNQYDIKEISYFNPRKGTLWHNDIQDLFSSVSNIPFSDFSYELESYLISQSQEFNPN